MLHCVALYCIMLQCVAVCCSVLQCEARCNAVLHSLVYTVRPCVAIRCTNSVAPCCSVSHMKRRAANCIALYNPVLQYVALTVLHRVAACLTWSGEQCVHAKRRCSRPGTATPTLCCSVLQCVADRRSRPGTGAQCSVSQCGAVRCSVLQCVADRRSKPGTAIEYPPTNSAAFLPPSPQGVAVCY